MGRDNDKTQINILLTDDEVVNQEVPQRIEQHIQYTDCTIAKHLQRHNRSQHRQVEKFDNPSYKLSNPHYYLLV
jgi:hypothetical protein